MTRTEDEMRRLMKTAYARCGMALFGRILQLHIEEAILGKLRVSAAMANALGYRMTVNKGVRTYYEIN